MIKNTVFLLLLLTNLAFANRVEIVTNPKEPVLGESFNVIFKVISKSATDPIISFDPRGIDVLGKEETGISTRTTYMNGKLSVERSISIVYEMVATKSGTSYLRNIKVGLNGVEITHKNVRIRVLAKAKKPKNIMAVAIVDKESAFVGEAILVRYYLYSQPQVSSTDIKRFPKLGKFLKRYHQESLRPERVEYRGQIYTRRIIYTAQLYAEKAGKYKIDPISMSVNYLKARSGGYGGFGFGIRQPRKKTVSSKPIEIEIKDLPIANVPKDFTGLVGEHKFNLTLNKKKFVVNEPIEIKLTVHGDGALELYQAPKLFESDKLEEFDTSNDFQVAPDFTSTKTFNITYLGRDSYRSESRRIPFSYFNPKTLSYETVELDLEGIVIAGTGGAVVSPKKEQTVKEEKKENSFDSGSKNNIDLTPLYKLSNTYLYKQKYINIILFLIVLGLLLVKLKNIFTTYSEREIGLTEEIRKEGLTYGRLHNLISLLGKEGDMRSIVSNSNLKESSKKYLYNLIEKSDSFYTKGKSFSKLKIKKNILNEIIKVSQGDDEDSF